MNITFFPYDFEYRFKQGKTYMYLYGKQENGQKICVMHHYDPYFYVAIENIDTTELARRLTSLKIEAKPEPAIILHWQEIQKELLGKTIQLWKIVVNFPKAVPMISKELESLGLTCYERDILFTHRYLRDNGLVPMTLTGAEGDFLVDSSFKIPLFIAQKVIPVVGDASEKKANWKILAFDLETYNAKGEINFEENPILMAGFYGIDEQGTEFAKVITWKHFSHSLPYLSIVENEAALVRECQKIIQDYNPDIITGYFSDVFDWPYLQARARKHNVTLNLGLDNSTVRITGKTGFREGEAEISGILHLDILKFIKNIFGKNLKTDSYSLDSVAGELLGHGKHVVNLDELSSSWDNNPDKLLPFCEYNLHDARLTHKLCSLLLHDITELTKVIGVPPFDVIRMRFSRLVENYILRRAVEYNVLAPNKPGDLETEQRMEESIQGAFVYEPNPGLYKDVVVFDFRSLYPTIITAHNLGPEALRCFCCAGKALVPGKEEYWFCTREKKFIPLVLEQLIALRIEAKKKAKQAKSEDADKKVLESRANALKLLANSFYGYLGFFGARWYCLECAAATTAYARNYIQMTMKQAQENGFSVVYADTDSCFLLLDGKKMDDALRFMDNVNKTLPGQMELELVGYFPRGIFVGLKGSEKGAKKRYALLSPDRTLKITGFESVRRNSSPLAREVQEKVLRFVLEDNVAAALDYTRKMVKDLQQARIPLVRLILKTQLTREISQYSSIAPHVMIAQKLQDRGEKVSPGRMIEFIIVKGTGLIRDRARLPDEVKEGEYDPEYYIKHQLVPAVNSLFAVFGYKEDDIFKESSQSGLGKFF